MDTSIGQYCFEQYDLKTLRDIQRNLDRHIALINKYQDHGDSGDRLENRIIREKMFALAAAIDTFCDVDGFNLDGTISD